MPIVRHTSSTVMAADGSGDSIVRLYDQDDTMRQQLNMRTAEGPDFEARIAAQIAAHIETVNVWLAELEYQQIIGEPSE